MPSLWRVYYVRKNTHTRPETLMITDTNACCFHDIALVIFTLKVARSLFTDVMDGTLIIPLGTMSNSISRFMEATQCPNTCLHKLPDTLTSFTNYKCDTCIP